MSAKCAEECRQRMMNLKKAVLCASDGTDAVVRVFETDMLKHVSERVIRKYFLSGNL